MKKSMRFTTLLLVFLLCMSMFSITYACSGYGSRTYWANEDKVYAKISACSCSPLDNHLYASTRAQCEAADQVYWTAWKEKYGDNVAYKSSSTEPHELVIAGTVHFRHKCGTGGSAYVYYDIDVKP